jgi:hypothetical protein
MEMTVSATITEKERLTRGRPCEDRKARSAISCIKKQVHIRSEKINCIRSEIY